jgi:hypothetical protein
MPKRFNMLKQFNRSKLEQFIKLKLFNRPKQFSMLKRFDQSTKPKRSKAK